MDGKVVLITGGTSGIGKAAAIALARMGAEVVVTGRNAERGERALFDIRRDSGSDDVSLFLADLSRQAEVRRLAEEFRSGHDRLDVLVNNAGMILNKRATTADGIEETLAINHLAPFLLTDLLLDLLKESAPSRIITVSSEAQKSAPIDFDDLQHTRNYKAFKSYGRSKLANVLFTYELAERLEGTGITANAMHPGAVSTNFGSTGTGPFTLVFRVLKPFMRSPEKGAETLIWLASAPELEGVSGRYYSDLKEIPSHPQSYEPSARKRLWVASEELTDHQTAPQNT
jgi:NAD(P)-dependent dehydrogenase (short-subunit alcohol dehydrogenase family)